MKSLTKTYLVEYYIIKPFKRKIERVAISRNQCKREFLKVSGVKKENVLLIKLVK